MPISIPTNIAGISIPTDAANGPLAALYGNKYKIEGLKYPRDLGSNPSRNHVIKFDIYAKIPVNLEMVQNATTNLLETGGEVVTNVQQAAGTGTDPLERSRAAAIAAAGGIQKIGGSVANLAKTAIAGNGSKRYITSIFLYVPDTLNVNYNSTYDDISITDSLGKAYFIAQAGASLTDFALEGLRGGSASNLGNKILTDPALRYMGLNALGNKVGMSNLGDLALQGVNKAINPQLQVMFRGVGFRTFQFDFLLTPYNKKEADDIKKIIHLFKFHSAPRISKGNQYTGPENEAGYGIEGLNGGFIPNSLGSPFFEVPETFEIDFMYKGARNPNVNRIAESVLTSVNVDYAPTGWATHNEGAPVQTRLTLQFQEIQIIDKSKIVEGF
jgi:hypothetical protein